MVSFLMMHSLTSFSEGLSVSAVEAQASGIPCVLSSSVSEETDLSGAVSFVDLQAPIEEWTSAIIKKSAAKIDNPTQKISDAGYEINNAARKLYTILTGDAK